jgi:hypothetical protein
MTDTQIVGEIAAQHALLLELTNQQRSTLAAVCALTELVISITPCSGDVDDVRQAFEDRREAIHKQLKEESVESLRLLQRAVFDQLLRSGK